MKLLFLSAWFPIPADNGSKLRVLNLLRELGRHHQVDLLTFAPEPPAEAALRELRTICREVEIVPTTAFPARGRGDLHWLFSPMPRSMATNYSPAMARAVSSRAGAGYDLVIASQIHMAPYALHLPGVPRLLEEIELVIMHDHYRRQTAPVSRLRVLLTWWKLTSYLRRILREFAAATVVSEPELALLRRIAPPGLRTAIVPNGVDLGAYSQHFGSPEPDLLIHPGALSWEPNLKAMRYFIGEIWPQVRAVRPQARLRITGRATPEQIASLPPAAGVEYTGFLEDVRPAIAQSWAEVVPLREGGGTRLKVLEALAIGTPIIATSKGYEGIDLVPERDILVADSPAEFAAQTLRLLASVELRGNLAAAGRRAVARYDWPRCVEPLETLIAPLATPTPG